MFTHQTSRRRYRSLLTAAVSCSLVLGAALVIPAAADTPVGWEKAPDPSVLGYLMVLVLIPLGIAAVLTVLTLLPSMAKSNRGYEPGQAWRGDSEWFGGPAKGVGAAQDVTPAQIEASSKETGGSSANW